MRKILVSVSGLALLTGAGWLAGVPRDGVNSVWQAVFGPNTAHAGDLHLPIPDGPLAPPEPPSDDVATADDVATVDDSCTTSDAALPLPLPTKTVAAAKSCPTAEAECSADEPDDSDLFAPTTCNRSGGPSRADRRHVAARVNELFPDTDSKKCPGGVCEVPRPQRKPVVAKKATKNAEAPARNREARRAAATNTAPTNIASRNTERETAPVRRVAEHRPLERAPSSNSANSGSGVTVDWLVPHEVNLGQAVGCQLLVNNRGAAEALDVAVEVVLPEDVRFEGADPEPEIDGDHLTWHIGHMSGDQTETILVRLAPQTEGNFTPRAAVRFTQATVAEIRVAQPELSLEVSGPQQASVGQSAAYQFHVTNSGAGAAVNVVVHAKLDPSFEHPQGERAEYRLGMLAAGETRTVEAILSGRDHGEFEVLGAVTAGDHILARAVHVVQIARPRLELNLEGPGRRFVDRKANYLVQIHNPGPAVAENVHVTQAVPDGFRFVQATPGGSYDAKLRQVGWFVGRLDADETTEVGLQLIPTQVGQHMLTAEVQADAGVIGSSELETRVDGVSAVVLEVVDMDDPVEVAGHTAYQLRVSNHGSIPARRVQVGARVPNQLRITDASGPSAGDVRDNQVVFDSLDHLAPGESRVFQVFVECLEAGQATFKAYVRSDDQEQPTTVEERTRVYDE